MTVITRFAPSPTGFLHIGGARTALFNYLYAKHMNGKFLLRIEDTDKVRSTQEAIHAIKQGLQWLEIDWDDEIVMQSSREKRHREVALELLNNGKAYYCYTSVQELEEIRLNEANNGKVSNFKSPWRDSSLIPPSNVQPVIRLKTPVIGKIIINDIIQGKVEIDCNEIDDFILLRSDGSPTYMLAVVVDDIDMGVTHIIRGNEHLINAARQNVIYEALGKTIPYYSHIPLIHGEDGAKLSKRHGALGVYHYQEMGYLKEAICNYLLKLGWGYENEEIISRDQAIDWFNVKDIGKSPAKFDFKKLNYLNAHYIKTKPNNLLMIELQPFIENLINRSLLIEEVKLIEKGLDGLKQRATNLKEMAEKSLFYVIDAFDLLTPETSQYFTNENKSLFKILIEKFEKANTWNKVELMELAKEVAKNNNIKIGDLMQMPRIALTGSTISPSVPEILELFGREKSLAKLYKLLNNKFK